MLDRGMLMWLGVAGAIVAASLSPPGGGGGSEEGRALTSLGHLPAYALLTAIMLRIAERGSAGRHRAALAAVATSVALGGLLEAVQPLVGRDGNLIDLALDAAGAGVAVLAWWYGWLPRRRATSN